MTWDALTIFLKLLHFLFTSSHTFMISIVGNYDKFIWKQLYIDELKTVGIPCLHLSYQHIKVYSQVKYVKYCIVLYLGETLLIQIVVSDDNDWYDGSITLNGNLY